MLSCKRSPRPCACDLARGGGLRPGAHGASGGLRTTPAEGGHDHKRKNDKKWTHANQSNESNESIDRTSLILVNF